MNEREQAMSAQVLEFLAHAQALETESGERYRELSETLEIHNNPEAAALFQKLAHYGESRAEEVVQQTGGMALPELPPWECQWLSAEGPHRCMEEAHYLMTPYQALRLVLRNESCSCNLYRRSLRDAVDLGVKKIASEMIREKEKHLEWLYSCIEREAETHHPPQEDLDPPNAPE